SVLGQERLVGGDHGLALVEGGGDPAAGRVDAAGDLDDDVDVLALDQRERVGGEQGRIDRQVRAVAAGAPHGDAGDLDGLAHPGGQLLPAHSHEAHDFTADGAASE